MSGVTPADSLLLLGQLAMGGRSRMNDQGFCVSHVGEVTQELCVFDEFNACFNASLHTETQYRPRPFG